MNDVKIRELQDKILEIAVYFDELCKNNGIIYYLMGGSALGAIRHNGFIPWDDDYDVFMTYDNYVKMLEVCKKTLDTEKYYLQEENTDEWPLFFTKLRMNGTTFIEDDTKERSMHKGVYIDIMCLNNVSNNKIYHFAQYLCALTLTSYSLAKRGYKTKNRLKRFAMAVTKIVITKKLKHLLISFVRSCNKKETIKVGHFFGKARFSKTSFPKDYLGKQRYVEFSGKTLPVPEQVEKYLTLRYGNYMAMPDQKTIEEYPVHAVYVNLNNDYSKYSQ